MIKNTILVLLLFSSLFAGELEQALDAFNNKEYEKALSLHQTSRKQLQTLLGLRIDGTVVVLQKCVKF